MDKQGIVESLRQPLNNIGLAIGSIRGYLEFQGVDIDEELLHLFDIVTRNIKRLDVELVEKVYPLEALAAKGENDVQDTGNVRD